MAKNLKEQLYFKIHQNVVCVLFYLICYYF